MEGQRYWYRAALVRVVDGDTVDVMIDLGFDVQTYQRLRLLGIDAPEMRGKQKAEGQNSKRALKALLEEQPYLIVKSRKRGKYGRYLADIYIPQCEVSVNDWLVEQGHARKYDI